MKRVEGLSARAISRRTGLARDTVLKLLAAEKPPAYSRAPAGSILDPFRDWICEQLDEDATTTSQRLREMAQEIGYRGGKTVFDDYVREMRPRYLAKRTFQRTIYRPAELIQCDLWEPGRHVPVGYGQTRRGWVVTSQSCWSRAFAGALIFSKEAPDILAGLARNLQRLGVRAEKLVWDRESAIAGRGRPTEAFLSFCGQLQVGWIILDAGDPQAKGQLERQHDYLEKNFEPRRSFVNHLDFQDQLDRWAVKANGRQHRSTRAVPADRLVHERELRPLGRVAVDTDRRQVIRVPAQPLIRVDRNDYSIDPVFAGRRIEVRVSQTQITATVLDTGELAARHRRIFAGHQTIVDPAHQDRLERQRQCRRQRHEVVVEQRPLSVYDQLIA
ncbi:MAG: Mu transposase domain-containing protein [Solirubrobacteraceae bacterium]